MKCLLAGRPSFDRNTVSDILAGVLRVDANFALLPQNLNPRLVEILRRCLEKNPKVRSHAVADLKFELKSLESVYEHPQTAVAEHRLSRAPLIITAFSLLVAISMGVVVIWKSQLRPLTFA